MPRKPRELVAGGVYHVYARGNRQQPIFLDEDDRRAYMSIWGGVVEHHGWRALAYCLMDNHVHHLVETPEPDLDVGMRLAHGSYGRFFNRTHAQTGHVFQGRFGSTRATDSGTVCYLAAYIVLNPVRAGMCERPEDYPWSSHAAVLGSVKRPRWLDVERLLGHFESDGETAGEHYALLVEATRVLRVTGLGLPHGVDPSTRPR